MKRINVLDTETSDKIAAGEVVERPFSVVKELIENSIDAEAKNITVEIFDGGQKNIKVTDDGAGIHPDDIEKAFLSHATSKISRIDDIFSIHTMGFRGEALPSIAAVSETSLKSRIAENDYGKEISISGGKINFIKETGCNTGTTIEVNNIFYNVPARQKFLKSSQRETALITDIVERLAIAHCDISFRLYSNGKKVLNTYSTDNMLDTLRTIYGKNVSDNLIKIESATDTISVYGYIGNAELSRGSRNNQSIFINRRYVKNRLITTAVEKAYKSFLTINKFPYFVLFIEIYPELVDVNVHPTKTEVKFQNEREIYKIVFDCVHRALRDSLKDTFMNDIDTDDFSGNDDGKIQVELPLDLHSGFHEIKNIPEGDNNYIEKHNSINDTAEKYMFNKYPANLTSVSDSPSVKIPEAQRNDFNENKLPELNIIGQFNKTYILAESSDCLYIIDQHAAHEKVLFEKYMNEIKSQNVISQILITPMILELDSNDFNYYVENKEIFNTAGFNIELFGDNTISIREVPLFLGKPDVKNLFMDIIDNLKELGSGKTSEVKYGVIAKRSCKAAVKANDILNSDEMKALLKAMQKAEDPFTCPHGRPTIIKITKYEMEKKFKRVL